MSRLLSRSETLTPVPTSIQDATVPPASSEPDSPTHEATPHLILDRDMNNFDLEAALESLPDNAVVQLGRIKLRLKKPVTIRRPITLRGSGMDRTCIVCKTSATGGVLNFEGDGPWILSGFTVERVKAEKKADDAACSCVEVMGYATISGCRFLRAPGAGLKFGGQSRALVTKCEAQKNWEGICVSDTAVVDLKDNDCRRNGSVGIRYEQTASGVAQGNMCDNNGGDGIEVAGQATPTLINNYCRRNKTNGIAYLGCAGGIAKYNFCIANGEHGVQVRNLATPHLHSNDCLRNRGNGIRYYGTAELKSTGNNCCSNIEIDGQAAPTFGYNNCKRNKNAGIYCEGTPQGVPG